MQLKIKTVEQLQQEQNLELLIKASEQHEMKLKEEEKKDETTTATVEKQQVIVEATAENTKGMNNEKFFNIIDLTDSGDEFTNNEKSTTGQATTSVQSNYRKRKRHHRHHRRHRRRQIQKSEIAEVAEQNNVKLTTSQEQK